MGGLPNQEQVMAVIPSRIEKEQCYVAECESQVVGVALLDDVTRLGNNLQSLYATTELSATVAMQAPEQKRILDLLLINPIFGHRRRFLLQEIMRRSQYVTCL